jgi:cytochrome c biogenesis protein CcdA
MPLSRPYPDLRASDAERERVAVFLRDQAAVGRLSHEELEERVAAAYRAVTLGDLERLIADLPRAHPPMQRRRRHHPSRALLPVGFAALLCVAAPTAAFIVAAVAMAIGLAAIALVFALGMALGPFILVALLIVAALRRRRPSRRMRWDPRYF